MAEPRRPLYDARARMTLLRNEPAVAFDVRRTAWTAMTVASGAGLASLLDFEFVRAFADRLAPDGNAATYNRALHATYIVDLRAIAMAAAAFGAALVARGPAIARALACSSADAHAPAGRRSFLFWSVIFVVLLLGVRLWYLDYEGWDESTFIIISSHVLQGHLPYLELFEIKPPGIFFALAGVMSAFGENLPAVRLFGMFCLLAAAVAGYAIAVRRTTPLIAGASMAVFCVLTSASEFQQTLTEHLVLALIMPALWLLVACRDRLWAAFLVGVLLSAATLTRTNIAYVVLAVGAYYGWRYARPRPDVPHTAIAAYCLGGALPLGSLVLLYWAAGGLDVFVLATFSVPLHYATSQLGMTEAILRHVGHWMRCIYEAPGIWLPTTLLVGAGLTACAVNRGKEHFRGHDGLLLLVLVATALSILSGGAAWGHYQLQVLPLVMVLAAAGFVALKRQPLGTLLFLGLSILIVGAALGRFGDDSLRWVRNELTGPERLTSLQRAAILIRDDRSSHDIVYAPAHHLIYWYLKQSPPSVVVHPSSLNRPAIMTPLVEHGYVAEDEQLRILATDFGYVVIDPDDGACPRGADCGGFAVMLRERFRPWKVSGDLVIYKRRRAHSSDAPGAAAEPT